MANTMESPRGLALRRSLARFARIRDELGAASARRTRLWQAASSEGRPADPRITELDERIERLWRELREARAEALAAPREQVIAEARAEERVYRELRRRLARTG